MVTKDKNSNQAKMIKSQPLKFGMDRILSEEKTSSVAGLEGPCSSMPPCAACLSSLHRCCRAPPNPGATGYCRGAIQAPLPLRPYTRVFVPAECNVNINAQVPDSSGSNSKPKRSWSRAVFSNLQRKGLEKRFQLQKYITKPDRRQLAATLGLTDAQVKVWFQNRRMKWRHTKEASKETPLTKETSRKTLLNPDSNKSQDEDFEYGSDVDVQTIDS